MIFCAETLRTLQTLQPPATTMKLRIVAQFVANSAVHQAVPQANDGTLSIEQSAKLTHAAPHHLLD